jgi:alkylation response protein AidB-like acyl-CoA dehydrogenase
MTGGELSAEQVALKRAAIEFARTLPAEDDGSSGRSAWRQCADFGVQCLLFPAELDGQGGTVLDTVAVMEGLGYGCRNNGLLFALNAQIWSVQVPIWRFGSTEQQARYLRPLCRGELVGAHAMTEPQAGSDAFSLRTRAVRAEGGYVLDGAKTFVTNAATADVFLVFATLNPDHGPLGNTAFLVDRSTPGLHVSRPFEKMGLEAASLAAVSLDRCQIGETARLGREGNGSAIFNSAMSWERACLLAPALGSMEWLVERCVAHATTRCQFGEPIGAFQAVSHAIADMQIRLEAARLLLYRAAALKQADAPATSEAAMAKLSVSGGGLSSPAASCEDCWRTTWGADRTASSSGTGNGGSRIWCAPMVGPACGSMSRIPRTLRCMPWRAGSSSGSTSSVRGLCRRSTRSPTASFRQTSVAPWQLSVRLRSRRRSSIAGRARRPTSRRVAKVCHCHSICSTCR